MDRATIGVVRHAGVDRRPRPPRPVARRLSVVVTSVASDAHTWNLIFLQRTLEELGHHVRNLGNCVPDDLVVAECLRAPPGLVVVSTVNGHGFHDGTRLIRRIRACPALATTPVVIGGKLDIEGRAEGARHDDLRSAGFDAVFEGDTGMGAFRALVGRLTVGAAR